MTSRRVFVGLLPAGLAAERLCALARASLDERDWRIYPPADIHLTLCFLGEVAQARIETLVAALAGELEDAEAFALSINGAGSFGSTRAPIALWAGVGGAPEELARLAMIQQKTAAAARAAGLACDGRRFNPHFTLARPRGRADVPEAFRALVFDEPWSPDRVLVFESPGARATDRRYPTLAELPLRTRTD